MCKPGPPLDQLAERTRAAPQFLAAAFLIAWWIAGADDLAGGNAMLTSACTLTRRDRCGVSRFIDLLLRRNERALGFLTNRCMDFADLAGTRLEALH
jgi:hypothetical protein